MPESVAALLAILFYVLTVQGNVNCQRLLYGSRLASFPKPDFRVNFTLFSQRGSHSYKEIRHGLNVDPFYVRVYARGKSLKGNSFCFNGVGASQASPEVSGYGGLIYAYNSMYVRIWAPTQYKSFSNGRIIYLKDGWGSGWDVYQMSEAEVVVEVWRSGPTPALQFDIPVDTRKLSFHEIKHKLGQTPERISVSITPYGSHYPRSNPNRGFWFDAIGSSQNPNPTTGFGGVIFAYNARRIRLWTADGNVTATGCVFVGHGWGNENNTQYSKKCIVRVRLWTNALPAPVFQSEWQTLKAQRNANSVKDIFHNLGILPSLVIVQLRIKSGINLGFIFEGQGAVMSGDNNVHGYGGTTFAYDKNVVRVWAPSRKDGSSSGFAVLVKNGWGDGKNLQWSLNVDYRIIIHSSPCDSSFETTFERDTCINTKYLSYQWTNFTQWSRCSSICNNGTKIRETQGCKVTSRRTILACNFKRDFCGWTSTTSSAAKMQWIRTNQATPEPKTGPAGGPSKGSYYVYTNSTNFRMSQKGILTSPKVNNGKKCLLRFFWNMYGRDVGEFFVHVKHHGRFGSPVWGMKRSQGEFVWRQAVINLESYTVQKVRFIHQLPRKDEDFYGIHIPCPNKVCPQANVAISNIKLECEGDSHVLDAEVCRKRLVTSASCEHYSSSYTIKGPAYSEETVFGKGKTLEFVKALGKTNDLIASYRFRVIFKSHYNLWAQVFSRSKKTNSFFFRVNDGDWHHWHTVILKSYPLWQYFRYKSFLLNPGIHLVTLKQSELGFRLDRLILAPVRVTQWTDLGMQSRHISDLKLQGYPDNNSKPPPKYGRLNGVDAWCSTDHNPGNVFFQITLPDLAIVSRIAVQGGQNIYRKSNNYWVISFNMKVALDGFFTWYRNRTGGIKEFQANKDAGGIVNHTLESPVPVRGIKIYPKSWKNWICMRTELYGMYILPEVCATAPKPELSNSCAGNRDCGKNAECGKVSVNKVPKQVFNATKYEVGLERCHCHNWYHGPSCQHYGCKPNPCLNKGKCSENNGKFRCKCPAGYHGIICQHPCPTGRYGNNCSGVCLCTQHGTCDAISGTCNCYKGYRGIHCEKDCPNGYYGYNCSQKCQCRSGSVCDKVNGACNCTPGNAIGD